MPKKCTHAQQSRKGSNGSVDMVLCRECGETLFKNVFGQVDWRMLKQCTESRVRFREIEENEGSLPAPQARLDFIPTPSERLHPPVVFDRIVAMQVAEIEHEAFQYTKEAESVDVQAVKEAKNSSNSKKKAKVVETEPPAEVESSASSSDQSETPNTSEPMPRKCDLQ